jgi:hypothetical protein
MKHFIYLFSDINESILDKTAFVVVCSPKKIIDFETKYFILSSYQELFDVMKIPKSLLNLISDKKEKEEFVNNLLNFDKDSLFVYTIGQIYINPVKLLNEIKRLFI